MNPKFKKMTQEPVKMYKYLVIITQNMNIEQFKIVKNIVSLFIHTNTAEQSNNKTIIESFYM